MEYINPPLLKKGDTIGVISPSGGLAALVPHRLDNAIKFLEEQGYKIKEFSCTRKNNGWESASAEERAKDIMNAFLDKEVNVIICSIGGNTSNKTLKYLDFEKIKQNPKILCGYSDISVLHYAILKKTGLSTFYGPCMMTQFGEHPKPLDYTIEYFNKAVKERGIGEIKSSKKWTDEVLDWFAKKDLERPRKLKENSGFEWIKKGQAKGKIIGGCLHSLIHLIGTEYWPSHQDKILFIETPEGDDFTKGESLAEVDAQLGDLDISGIFGQIKGLIVGRPFGQSEEEVKKFKEIILDNTKDYNFPILFGIDIGHTDPQITIPLGAEIILNSSLNKFSIDEAYVTKN